MYKRNTHSHTIVGQNKNGKKNPQKPLQRATEQDFLRPQLHIPSISFIGIYPTGILGFMHKSGYSCFYCSFYNSKGNSLNIYLFKSYILTFLIYINFKAIKD